jgi:hypothetical protein
MILDEPNYFEIKRNKVAIVVNMLINCGLFYYFSTRLNEYIADKSYWRVAICALFLLWLINGFIHQFNILRKNLPILSIGKDKIYLEKYGYVDKALIKSLQVSEKENGRTYFMAFLHNPEYFLDRETGLRKRLLKTLFEKVGTPMYVQLKSKYDKTALDKAIEHFNESIL